MEKNGDGEKMGTAKKWGREKMEKMWKKRGRL